MSRVVDAGHDQSHPGDIRGRLVRIAFLVRLLTLAYGALALASDDGRPATAVLLAALALTSHLGLQHERVRRLVVRHPNRGVFVASLGPGDIHDVYTVRRFIEVSAIRGGGSPGRVAAVRSAVE